MDRQEFLQQLADFDEDDIQELPQQNKKNLDQIMRALTNGEHLPPFSKQKIGSYGDDIINQVMRQTYQDTQEVVQLLQGCCFCQAKVHRHILKKAKETLDEHTQALAENAEFPQQQRVKLFKLLCALAECGIDNEFRVIRTAFVYFMRQLDVVGRRLEMLPELTLQAIQKLCLIEFYDANCEIIAELLDLHVQGILHQLSEEQLATFANQQQVAAQIALDLQHFATWHECLEQVYGRFSSLSKQFRDRQQLASREREPTKKDAILQVVKFGGQLMPVIQRFLDVCRFQRQLDFFSVLNPREELEIGNKYYPELFERISVGKLSFAARDTGLPNMLWNSFSSKAELQFDVPDDAFHSITKQFVVHDPDTVHDQPRYAAAHRRFEEYSGNLHFMLKRAHSSSTFSFQNNFSELFAQAHQEQEVEILVQCMLQQEEENEMRDRAYYDFAFSVLACNLFSQHVNARLLAYLIALLHYNNITVYWRTAAGISYEAFQARQDKITFPQGLANYALKDNLSSQTVTLLDSMLFYRLISTIQYGKIICGLANKFRKIKDMQQYDSLCSSLASISLIFDFSSQYFILIDSDGFQQIYDNYFEKAIKNLKAFHEGNRSQNSEYLYRRFSELSDQMLEFLDAVNQRVEATDERILKEQQLAYDMQFRKYKFKKAKKFAKETQEAPRRKTEKQQKFEDLDTALFGYSISTGLSTTNYEHECSMVLKSYDDAVQASYKEAQDSGERNVPKSHYFVKHAQDLFDKIFNYTTLASYGNIVFLYRFMFKNRIDLREPKQVLIARLDHLQFGVRTALTKLALFEALQETLDFSALAKQLFQYGFELLRVSTANETQSNAADFVARPLQNRAAKITRTLIILARLAQDDQIRKLAFFCVQALGSETMEQDFIEELGQPCLDDLNLSVFPHSVQLASVSSTPEKPDFLKYLESIDC